MVLALTAAVAALAATAALGGSGPGFKTAQPAQLVPLVPGVIVDPIISTSDIVGGYQMTGIPDGLGAYKTGAATLQVFMNHELDSTPPDSPAGVGARVSHLVLDRKTTSVLDANYAIKGTEGFSRFCSSTLEILDNATPWYFTGEEATERGALTDDPSDGIGRGGTSIALNAETGDWVETRHFGLMLHENIVPLERLSKAMIVTTDDNFAGDSYLYSFIANTNKFADAIAGNGSLYVWRADNAGRTSDIHKGETLDGHFVPISQAENTTAETLRAASTARGAFKFVRLEDAAKAQQRPGQFYFSDTGRLGTETVRGRFYRMDVDPADPTHASLTLLLDGDAGDNMVNPDNIDTSSTSVVIQEDRNSEHRDAAVRGGYGRVLVYDISTGTVRVVARVNTPPAFRPGEWESSGVINANTLLGGGWWLLDVQAHLPFGVPQPGVTLAPNTATGEGGQLLAVYIPGS